MRLDRFPKHLAYSAAGLILAVGAPAGMVLRARPTSATMVDLVARARLRDSWLDYLYVGAQPQWPSPSGGGGSASRQTT